jgi:hypothetical protein
MTLYRATTPLGPVDNTLSTSAVTSVLKGWAMGYDVIGWKETNEDELEGERYANN